MKLEPAVGAGPHRRRVRRTRLLLALPIGLLLTCLPGAPVAAQSSTTTKATAAEPSPYRLARVVGGEYVFDIPMTADFGQLATCTSTEYSTFSTYCSSSTETVGGSSYKVVRTEFTWDTRNGVDWIETGELGYSRMGDMDGSTWVDADKGAPGWPALVSALKSQASRNKDGWSNVRLVVLASPSPAGDPVRLPIPELEQARLALVSGAKETVAGTYYPGVKVPKDLAGYQAQMLAYGNAGRRDPDFRKKNGSQTALDLGADFVNTRAGSQRVFRDNKTPPYFDDQVPTDALTKAAQFQAEYVASVGRLTHDGPSKNQPSNKTGVNMTSLEMRSAYFGGPRNVVEGIALTAPGEAPRTLMKGETHFRPFFNVDGFAPDVGYGVAQSANGSWFFSVVWRIEKDKPSKTLAEVDLPAKGSVGVPSPPADATVTAKAVEPTATQTTGPSSMPPGVTSAPAPTSTAPTTAPVTTTTPTTTTTTTGPIVRGATTIYGVQAAKDCASIPAPQPGKVRVRFLNQDPSRPPAEDFETDLFLYDANTRRQTSVPQFLVPAGTTFDVETTPGTVWSSVVDAAPPIQTITVGSGPTQCERGVELVPRDLSDGRDDGACRGITPLPRGVKVRFVNDAQPESEDGAQVDATITIAKVVWKGATGTTEEPVLLRSGRSLELRAEPGTVYQVKRKTPPKYRARRDFDVAVGKDPTQCVRFPGSIELGRKRRR